MGGIESWGYGRKRGSGAVPGQSRSICEPFAKGQFSTMDFFPTASVCARKEELGSVPCTYLSRLRASRTKSASELFPSTFEFLTTSS